MIFNVRLYFLCCLFVIILFKTVYDLACYLGLDYSGYQNEELFKLTSVFVSNAYHMINKDGDEEEIKKE